MWFCKFSTAVPHYKQGREILWYSYKSTSTKKLYKLSGTAFCLAQSITGLFVLPGISRGGPREGSQRQDSIVCSCHFLPCNLSSLSVLLLLYRRAGCRRIPNIASLHSSTLSWMFYCSCMSRISLLISTISSSMNWSFEVQRLSLGPGYDLKLPTASDLSTTSWLSVAVVVVIGRPLRVGDKFRFQILLIDTN